MDKIFSVAILGVGARGGSVYGRLIKQFPDKFKIVALCDIRTERLEAFGEEFGVPTADRFTDEKVFFEKKRADLLVIATQDEDHVRNCLQAFETGYDILMEKPITDKKEECEAVLAAQKKYGCKAIVCHVLRYAPAFLKAAELIENGEIGRLVAIDALERVTYWHQAHSYVRGNWRTTKSSAPMILAKCCHDLDLIQYYANSKCKSVSSVGELTYFNAANAPEDSADRCLDCPRVETCPYSAKRLYLDRWKKAYCPEDYWPYNVLVQAPVTEEKLTEALKNGPYGRCVFRCDNDVVDHQLTLMAFENGVKA
ncbi:MAG: Gfo/Idh/MocA family oxidoreductase, partial [Clostridia bacterium]|nr:Gfo/Idh/MocA family oxidoreductase [Clostridia bacterium]